MFLWWLFVLVDPVLGLDWLKIRPAVGLSSCALLTIAAPSGTGCAVQGVTTELEYSLCFWCPHGLGRVTLAVTQHSQVGLGWLARPWRLFLQMPVPAVGTGGL